MPSSTSFLEAPRPAGFSTEYEGLRALFSTLTAPVTPAAASPSIGSPFSSTTTSSSLVPAAPSPQAYLTGNAVLEMAEVVGLVAIGRPLALALDSGASVSFDVFLTLVDEMRREIQSSLRRQQSAPTSMSIQLSPIGGHGCCSATACDGTQAETLRLQLTEAAQVIEQLRNASDELIRKQRTQETAAKAAAAEIESLRDRTAELEDKLRKSQAREAELKKQLSGAVTRMVARQRQQHPPSPIAPTECANCAELQRQMRQLHERVDSLEGQETLSREIASSATETARKVLRDRQECARCMRLHEQIELLHDIITYLRETLRSESQKFDRIYQLLLSRYSTIPPQ